MVCPRMRLYSLFLICMLFFVSCTLFQPDVRLHYLGHSSFFLDFNGKTSVLCDYGKENAYLQWGWNSPIYDAGIPGPDILCYSHEHEDHNDPIRAAQYESCVIRGDIDTCFGDLSIRSFPGSEQDISRYDNHAYLFTYKDIRVLHLGDCQADIMMINDPAHEWNLSQRYPKGCDIVIMPIESTRQFILQAVRMAELLEPRVLIPAHYWSEEYKQAFLEALNTSWTKKGKSFHIEHLKTADYVYRKSREEDMLILDMRPSARHEP